jgi:hypothetical protein
MIIKCCFLHIMRILSYRIVNKIKTLILRSITFFFENRAVYEIMWKRILEPDRPQMAIWRMRITCWITKTTDTHSDYVILVSHSNSDARIHLNVVFICTLPVLLVTTFNCVLGSWWPYVVPVFSTSVWGRKHISAKLRSRNLAIALGGGQKSTTGVKNFSLRSSQVIKRRKIGLNRPLISIHPFPQLYIFYLPLFRSVSIRKLFLCRKKYWRGVIDSPCISKLYPCRCECHVTGARIVFSICSNAVLVILTWRDGEFNT